jgi:hypothetical protein
MDINEQVHEVGRAQGFAQGFLESFLAVIPKAFGAAFAREFVATLAKVRIDDLRFAVAQVLEARAVTLTAGRKLLLEECKDWGRLWTWLRRASTATSENDVFARPTDLRVRGDAEG